VIVAIAASAAAQQAPESPPAAWRVECAGDGKTLDCRAVQQVFRRSQAQYGANAFQSPLRR
jgi:invasion protein IalB